MAQPVWVLSVDLQAKTATFQTRMSDAARSARGAFDEIGNAAQSGGRGVGRGMTEARHSVMMLGEEFGIHIPRALASFIAGLGPIGAAMEAAFPFLAIILGATLLIEHLEKLHAAGMKLTADQLNLGTAANNAFNTLEQKLIQAQIRSDELRNDHMGALKLQLELIDQQSFAELVHSFEELDKAADTVFKDLEGHWYTLGIGSDGAKAALDDFKAKYDNLLSQNTDAGRDQAHNLLAGTLKTAQEVLAAQQTIKANRDSGGGQTDESFAAEAVLRAHRASLTVTHDEIAAQEAVVTALQKQVQLEGVAAQTRKADGDNDKTQAGNEAAARRAAAARQSAESMLRLGEQSIQADKATADATLEISRASLEQRLASDIDFAGRERDVKLAANQAEIAALDKSGKDYQNQLKALNEKALEIGNEYDTKVTELKAKSSIEVAARDLQQLEQSEREKIEATQQGSAARLTAINAAIRQEEAAHLQDTSFYRDLLNQRIEAIRQETEEDGKLREEAARQEADADVKAGELKIAAEKQQMALADSARRASVERRIAEETQIANDEYTIKMAALQKETDGLNKSGKDYENKLKVLQDQEKQLTQAHENELTQIKQKAEEERNQRILAAEDRLTDSISRGLTQSIMGHQTWARMVQSLGDQVVSGMIENAIKSMMVEDMTKEKDAAAAARKAFNLGLSIGGPAGVVLGPVMGAAAFAAVMAFADGTDGVPGMGRGDIVPTMLEPGEGVVPGGVMDGLRNLARSGGLSGNGNNTVVHVRPTYHVNTIDGDGMQAALEKHTDQLQRHFESALRKMNR